jgi:hypothetical protein
VICEIRPVKHAIKVTLSLLAASALKILKIPNPFSAVAMFLKNRVWL